MSQLIYDGSFDGLLCALSFALKQNAEPEDIVPEEQRQALLFAEESPIETEDSTAREMAKRIAVDISRQAFRNVMHVHLSELPNMGIPLLHYVREGLTKGKQIDAWHANADVQTVHKTAQKTTSETYRLKGLLRFRELTDGTLWAPVEPDHQVIVPVAFHFRKRLPAEHGIIHDIRRGMAVSWDDGSVTYVDPPELEKVTLTGNEKEIQQLWQTYIKSTTIKERINPRLQKRCIPARYWKWLTEGFI